MCGRYRQDVSNLRASTTNKETRLNSFHLDLKTNKFKTEIRRNFYTVRAVDQWNQLPNYVKDSNNVNQFKRAYKLM